MAWRYRRRLPILKGLTVNLGKSGVTSVSLGVRGARLTFGRRVRRATIGPPGSGLSYTAYERYRRRSAPAPNGSYGMPGEAGRRSGGGLLLVLVLILLAIAAAVVAVGGH
jgi:hypothetical protein